MLCRYLGIGRFVALLHPIWKWQVSFCWRLGSVLNLGAQPCSKYSVIPVLLDMSSLDSRQYQPQHPVLKSLQPHWLLLTSASKHGSSVGQEAADPAGEHHYPVWSKPVHALPTSVLHSTSSRESGTVGLGQMFPPLSSAFPSWLYCPFCSPNSCKCSSWDLQAMQRVK